MIFKQKFELKITGVLLELLGCIPAVVVGEHVFLTFIWNSANSYLNHSVIWFKPSKKS